MNIRRSHMATGDRSHAAAASAPIVRLAPGTIAHRVLSADGAIASVSGRGRPRPLPHAPFTPDVWSRPFHVQMNARQPVASGRQSHAAGAPLLSGGSFLAATRRG
jgi:hypothetical protein